MSNPLPPLRPRAHLLPTLFDRLRDEAPTRQTELPDAYAVNPRQLREIIQRDLMYLLNTANIASEIDLRPYPEVADSVLNYGMPPITGTYMHDHQWMEIEKAIRRAILNFEPRIEAASLAVKPMMKNASQSDYNILLFEISGRILTEPYPTTFLVQSAFDLESGRINVIG